MAFARGTSHQPPLYHSSASNNDYLPPMSSSWHVPNESAWHASEPSSASLQPRGEPSHQGAFGECTHQSPPLAFASNSVYRQGSAGWLNDVWGNEMASRSAFPSRAPVPLLTQSPAYHRSSSQVQSEHLFEDFRQLEGHPPTACIAPVIAPPFLPATQKSAPHLLNQPLQTDNSLRPPPSQLPGHVSTSWSAGPSSDLFLGTPQATNVVASISANAADPQWSMIPGTSTSAHTFHGALYDVYHSRNHEAAPIVDMQYDRRSVSKTQDYRRRNPPADTLNARRAAPKQNQKLPKMVSSMLPRHDKNRHVKRMGALDEPKKQKAAFNRKHGICIRCKLYKTGCDSGVPCKPCYTAAPGARSYHGPCVRHNLFEANIVRYCNGRLGQEEAAFLSWKFVEGSGTWLMPVLWNLPGAGPIPKSRAMGLRIRKHLTDKFDTSKSVWKNRDGEFKQIEQPPYAIIDTASLVAFLESYFLALQAEIENTWLFARIQHDEIASLTFLEAIRLRNNGSKALRIALMISCLSIVSQGYGTAQSNDVPGIQEVDYKRMGHSEYEAYNRDSCERPLPPSITHAIDVGLLKALKRLEKELIKILTDMIFKPKIKPWYELFLTFFVIFWNLDYIRQGATSYNNSKHGTSAGIQVRNVVANQIARWDMSYPILMQYWPAISRNFNPFTYTRENPGELLKQEQMDAEGFKYWMRITEVFDRTGPSQHIPPLTGQAFTQYSLSSEWIVKLFKEMGA